jgi:hypothetical protein
VNAELLASTLTVSLPVTLIEHEGVTWLVAGEDLRWSVEGAHSAEWLPGLIGAADGTRPVAALLESLPERHREAASATIEHLAEERLLVASADLTLRRGPRRIEVIGEGALADAVRAQGRGEGEETIRVLCQDTLDFASARRFGAQERDGVHLWATVGPVARAFVSPVLKPGQGPCVGCIVTGFRRLSPTPELYDALDAHTERSGTFAPARVGEAYLRTVAGLVAWKLSLLDALVVPPAVFRMHVLEHGTVEVSSHALVRDADCDGHA